MSGVKSALRTARVALDAQKYDEAVVQIQIVLASDSKNYQAKVFLGLALAKQGKLEEAIKAYQDAIKIKPKELLAWQGILRLYESQGSKNLDEYRSTAISIAEIYAEADDKHNCQTVIDKLISFTKENGSRAQYKRALEVLLPTSPVYDCLEGRIPHPSYTYIKFAEITEAEEKERINKEIGERRTRLGARLGQVTAEVKREVLKDSPLESLYQDIIDWSNDDDVRRAYEERLLQRAYDALLVLPSEAKAAKREQVMSLAHGMVIIKHPFELAWELVLEWHDSQNFVEWDLNVLQEYIDFFPDKGLSKVLRGYLSSEISPFPQHLASSKEGENSQKDVPLSAEERLLLLAEGLQDSYSSLLAHRLMSDYYLHIEEYESAVEVSRKALALLSIEAHKSGLKFQSYLDAIRTTLATALIHYQAPKNHPEARSLFDSILQRQPNFTPALIGLGLILEEQEEYGKALDFFNRALAHDQANVRLQAEAAWCKALNGNHAEALGELESCLSEVKVMDQRTRDLKAQLWYRVGTCLWILNTLKSARKDRQGAYSRFLAAIKTNLNYAPAYTSLGIYYADYAKDRKRARQCFQKAFELSAAEVEAAERLARAFADERDWDLVEVIAQRVVDSGRARPAPGSKRKGLSWPFAALGLVQMNKQEYSKSVISFQAALRISPDDYHSWVGLGESYHNSGRYNAASRTFMHAEELANKSVTTTAEDSWFAQYMLANVNRELGEYDQAITGYRAVLKVREKEFGVMVALLQTLVETAWRSIETGFFGRAVECSRQAIALALSVSDIRPEAFNLWKAVGDSCVTFSWVQSRVHEVPFQEIQRLLQTHNDVPQAEEVLAQVDGIELSSISSPVLDREAESVSDLERCLYAAIMAHKRAIAISSHDIHAQAVAWYNLGWTEYRTYQCTTSSDHIGTSTKPTRFLKAAMRCFKRAIELEAGNAEFWNALGVVTTQMNPKVAQHSFVRSLHVNEKSARTWTNIGTLYLLQGDYELAHDAFGRGQSTDPDYAHAWVGEGIIALLLGDAEEALSHFTHAFDIADSSSVMTKRQFGLSTFDHIISRPAVSNDIGDLIQPIFALRQLYAQAPKELSYRHISALLYERVGDHAAAVDALTSICAATEAEYEVSESATSMARFAQAKADLSRNQLAELNFAGAIESSETALDLSAEPESNGLSAANRKKVRLSAHLVAGLACYYTGSMDKAIDMFRAALEETANAADVVCLLAQVLWAKGGEKEKNVARDRLFDCIENNQGHVGAVVLLGAIAVLDNDEATMEAVESDLQALRTSANLNPEERRKIEDLLALMSPARSADSETSPVATREVLNSILLSPSHPHGWTHLGEISSEPYPAEMALATASHTVPPYGATDAIELSNAFAGTGTVGDAQRAIATCPWLINGWQLLKEAVR